MDKKTITQVLVATAVIAVGLYFYRKNKEPKTTGKAMKSKEDILRAECENMANSARYTGTREAFIKNCMASRATKTA